MLREVVYSGIRMGTYELFKDKSVFSPQSVSNLKADKRSL